jgi:16S rRNA (cytidine1402-2'-O)-methyltransferase
MGKLFLVATPIGNLEDISFRALKTLQEVELIAAEDTRQTVKLLTRYGIQTPSVSYYEYNKLKKIDHILQVLQSGDVALVSDAGSPALNDPGYELVSACLEAGYQVSPVPGPNAPIAALIASGLPTDTFLYLGYLPRKSNLRKISLENVRQHPYTLIFLETPHRLLAALSDIQAVLGDRKIAIARELTKLHEEIFRGKLSQAIHHFTDQKPRGEFTLVVAGLKVDTQKWGHEQLCETIQEALHNDLTPAKIAQQISSQSGWQRRQVYKLITEIQENVKEGKYKDYDKP